MTKITHIAVFATNEGAIQSTGASPEAAIAAAVRDTGVPSTDLAAKPVTKRMGALLSSGVTPTSWMETDGMVDCKIDYAVFSHTATVYSDDGEVQVYVNLHGHDIEAESAHAAAVKALGEIGLHESSDYLVVSYPRMMTVDEIFESYRELSDFTLLPGVAELIVTETVEVDAEDISTPNPDLD